MTQDNDRSVWDYKPWWCQPWSIGLTGITLIAGSWWVFQRLWLTILVAIPVLIWMGFFLMVYPQLVKASGLLPTPSPKPDSPRFPDA